MGIFIDLGYLIAALLFILGLKFMSSPKNAQKGNLIAAAGMLLAVICTVITGFSQSVPLTNYLIIGVALLAGIIVGSRMATTVEMTEMPQLVSLFNATGGGCAMLLGLIEVLSISGTAQLAASGSQILLLLGVITGAIAFTGSILAYLKLAGKVKDKRSLIVPLLSRVFILVIVVLPVLYFVNVLPVSFAVLTYIIIALSLIYGIFFVLPIGGADMPVVISLLNAITGIASALAGLLQGNKAMVTGGIFVGAAGILLTLLMCKAMNRSLVQVIAGKFNKSSSGKADSTSQDIQETSVSETLTQLSFANKIAIIPGYGLAVAQAQYECFQLQQLLEEQDKTLDYIIHPVAGRMPGHMNVLLAEAKIDYDHLLEMEEANPTMEEYDLVLVVGANDVVNPAAESDPDSPIHGMPIIRAHKSKNVVVIKRSMNTGYAGIKNDLFEKENCKLLFGDAKKTLKEIIDQLKLMS